MRPQDQPLWDALRALRTELAAQFSVPPYVIFHDTTLQEMTRSRPQTAEQLRQISGVGEQKLQRYGEQFLRVIANHPLAGLLDNSLSVTINETLVAWQQGSKIAEIAAQRETQTSTIYSHLAEAIAAGLVDVNDVIGLSAEQQQQIVLLMESLEGDEAGRLKPVFDAFDGQYDYGVLRCVQAALTSA